MDVANLGGVSPPNVTPPTTSYPQPSIPRPADSPAAPIGLDKAESAKNDVKAEQARELARRAERTKELEAQRETFAQSVQVIEKAMRVANITNRAMLNIVSGFLADEPLAAAGSKG